MTRWTITPSKNDPRACHEIYSRTQAEDAEAIEYAKDVLEQKWNELVRSRSNGIASVTIEARNPTPISMENDDEETWLRRAPGHHRLYLADGAWVRGHRWDRPGCGSVFDLADGTYGWSRGEENGAEASLALAKARARGEHADEEEEWLKGAVGRRLAREMEGPLAREGEKRWVRVTGFCRSIAEIYATADGSFGWWSWHGHGWAATVEEAKAREAEGERIKHRPASESWLQEDSSHVLCWVNEDWRRRLLCRDERDHETSCLWWQSLSGNWRWVAPDGTTGTATSLAAAERAARGES